MKNQSVSVKNQAGYTIIELMISMVVFLTAIAMIYQVMQLGTMQKNTINTHIDAVKGARISLNYLRRDVVNAGLSYHNIGGIVPDNFSNRIMNSTSDADTDQDLLTGIMPADNVSTNILNTNNPMDAIGLVSRDLDFNDGKFINFISTSASGSDVLVKTAPGGTLNCRLYDLYLFQTDNTQVVGIVTAINSGTDTLTLGFGTTDPIGVNQSASATGTSKSLLIGTNIKGAFKKIEFITYSVSADGTLISKTYANQLNKPAAQQIVTRELVRNIKDFQVSYVLDDGTTTSDPSLGNNGRANQQQMNRVVEVQISLTIMPDNETMTQIAEPVTIKEVISTRNLRYTIG